MRVALFLAVIALVVSFGADARADLQADADRLIAAWNAEYAQARRVRTLFLQEGETRRVALRAKKQKGRCISMVAIAERQIPFRLKAGAEPAVESKAGVAIIRDCRGRRLRRGVLDVTASRAQGAVEIIAVVHVAPLTRVTAILAERAVGSAGDTADAAGGLKPDPLAERERRARRAAALDGAEMIVPVSMSSGTGGSGTAVLRLGAGCHRVAVLAEADAGGEPHDVDAEARPEGGGASIAHDRSHAPDARLEFCLGATRRVEVRFVGAPPGADVTILTAFWPIAPGIPESLGAEARGGIAWALHRRRAPRVTMVPVHRFIGAPGTTVLPLELEPGACYAAAMALTRGAAITGRLSARVGARAYFDDAFEPPNSAAITFCAEGAEHAQLIVEVRSRTAWWAATVWRLGDDGA